MLALILLVIENAPIELSDPDVFNEPVNEEEPLTYKAPLGKLAILVWFIIVAYPLLVVVPTSKLPDPSILTLSFPSV